jgi:hypothetical protein
VTETFTEGIGHGVGTLDVTNGTVSSTISLNGVGRIKDTMTAETLTVNPRGNGADNFVHVHNGPVVSGFQTDTVQLRNITMVNSIMDDQDLGALTSLGNFSPVNSNDDDSPNLFTFGTIDSISFANKTNLVINGNGSNNFFLVTVTKPAVGLKSMALDGVAGTNVAAIRSLPASVALSSTNIQVQAMSYGAVFIEELYEERLGRLASEAELDAWLKVFQTSGQLAVAAGIEGSLEARTELVKEFYLRYLGRAALRGEEQVWVRLLEAGETEEQVIAGILASSEFYARAQTLVSSGTPNQRYVQALYQVLLNRTAGPGEVQFWVNRLPTIGRLGVALGLLDSVEFRTAAITAYYVEFLQRMPDAAGLAVWLASGENLEQIRLGFEASGEFADNG